MLLYSKKSGNIAFIVVLLCRKDNHHLRMLAYFFPFFLKAS